MGTFHRHRHPSYFAADKKIKHQFGNNTKSHNTYERNNYDVTKPKLRQNGQQKRATCFETLLQNELNSDVARFTTHIQTCLTIN